MSKKIIILGTAHTSTTPGKRSPDGSLREANYSREIVGRLREKLEEAGYTVYVDYMPLIPMPNWKANTYRTEQNRELSYRVRRVNSICADRGTKNCLYISIHCNAAGSGNKWMSASGFSVYVSLNASDNSKRLAKLFTQNAIKDDLCGNRSIPSDKYWKGNLYVLRNTYCPAVLTENLFQDNKEDVEFLLSEEGKQAIVNLHFKSINDYCGV